MLEPLYFSLTPFNQPVNRVSGNVGHVALRPTICAKKGRVSNMSDTRDQHKQAVHHGRTFPPPPGVQCTCFDRNVLLAFNVS